MPATNTVRAGTFLAICLSAALLCSAAFAGDEDAPLSAASGKIKLSTFQSAAVVIGQTDFTGNQFNQGGSVAANTIGDPFGNAALSSKGVFYVPDSGNHRVLGFFHVPSANDPSPNFVLGQADLSSNIEGDAADQLDAPETAVAFKKMLLVSDYGNARVLIWKKAPKTSTVPADIVVGQTAFGMSATACAAVGLDNPESIAVGNGKLVVGDSRNNRVLIWNQIPTTNGQPPDLVLGQNNATTCVQTNDGTGVSGAPSATNFHYPAGVWTDGTRLVVADGNDNRVLIWTSFPTSNSQPADVVLGQLDFTTKAVNNDGSGGAGANPGASGFNFPYYVTSNGKQLFVADRENNRVLAWNKFPTANFQPADVVLGQPDFTCGVMNNDGSGCVSGAPSAKNLKEPQGLAIAKKQLIVTDGEDNRYLIFN